MDTTSEDIELKQTDTQINGEVENDIVKKAPKSRWKIWLPTVGCVLFAFLWFSEVGNRSQHIRQISALKSDISQLNIDISQLNSDNSQLKRKLSSSENEVANLRTENSKLKKKTSNSTQETIGNVIAKKAAEEGVTRTFKWLFGGD